MQKPTGASRDHENPPVAESRFAPKSAPPLLRLKASPPREALSRPYPSGLGARRNTKGLRQHKISRKRRIIQYAAGNDRNAYFFVTFRDAGLFVFDAASNPDGMNTENRRGRGECLKLGGNSTDSIAHRAICRGVDFRDRAKRPLKCPPLFDILSPVRLEKRA